MKFQPEQKGLFTFYKQQQVFQLQIERKKHRLQQIAEVKSNRKSVEKVNSQNGREPQTKSKLDLHDASKLKHNPSIEKTFKTLKLKKVDPTEPSRIQTQLLKKTKVDCKVPDHQTNKNDCGYFVQNKNVPFDIPQKQYRKKIQILGRRRKLLLKKKEGSIFSNKRYDKSEEHSQRVSCLPTLPKKQYKKTIQAPSTLRNKNVRSVFRFEGSNFIHQMRNYGLDDNEQKEANRSISYIQYNRLQYNPNECRTQKLSIQQKKLLQILSRYRQNDF